jgi:hypothetical protein
LLSRDEASRIAVNIAKLPELLSKTERSVMAQPFIALSVHASAGRNHRSFPSFLLPVLPDCTIQRPNDFRSWFPAGRAGEGGGSMWNERKMPERWYGLLRERMRVEEQRMRVIRDGDIVEHDDLEELLAQADSLDREMLLVMRQAIARTALAHEAA